MAGVYRTEAPSAKWKRQQGAGSLAPSLAVMCCVGGLCGSVGPHEGGGEPVGDLLYYKSDTNAFGAVLSGGFGV